MTTVVMAGTLRDFDVPSVLQAVSLSRQHTVLRLWDSGKRETGQIRLKAGQLLDAVQGERRGRTAFQSILRSKAHHTFRVERLQEPADKVEPMGPLASMLLDLPSAAETPPPTPPRMRSVPPPSPARLNRPSPPPSVPPRAPAITLAALSPKSAALAEAAKPLEGLLLAKLPECLLCKSWSRSEPVIAPETLATYVSQIVQTHRQCLSPLMPTVGEPTLTLELPVGTITIQSMVEDVIAVYVFAPQAPLGLVRLVVSQLHGPLVERARAELLPLRAAT
jgi:hypothetical protein